MGIGIVSGVKIFEELKLNYHLLFCEFKEHFVLTRLYGV